MELRELRFALRRYWPGAVVVFVVCLLVGAAAAYLPDKTYASSAQLFAQPRVGAAGVEGSAREAAFVIPGLVEKIESTRFRSSARDRAPEPYRESRIDVSASTDETAPSVLRIRVEGNDPGATAAWANTLAAELLDQEDPRSFVSLTLLDDARVPSSAIAPKPLPILLGSAVLGALAGLLVALVAFRARKAFDVEEDIRQLLGASLLAELPAQPQLRGRSDSTIFALLDQPASDLADAFQALRTEIEFRLIEAPVRSVAITSFGPGDGKSTVAAGLAWTLAAVGHRVTLVDADLRAPAVHKILGRAMSAGLADLEEIDLREAVRTTPRPGLDYLPAGLPHGRPGDVVSLALPGVIEELREDGHLVIVDSPPLGVRAEAPVIVNAARYVVLVVDRSRWDLPDVASAVSRLRESGATLLGVVVNRVPRRHWRRKQRYYRYPAPRDTRRRPSRTDGAPSVDRPSPLPAESKTRTR